jgi:lipopolysaccharide biosynthesis regulator YciM
MAKGDYAKAVESLLRVIDQDKELVSETLEMLQTCYQQLGKTDEWAAFLRRCVGREYRRNRRTDAGEILEQREGTIPRRFILRVSCSAIRRCAFSIS